MNSRRNFVADAGKAVVEKCCTTGGQDCLREDELRGDLGCEMRFKPEENVLPENAART